MFTKSKYMKFSLSLLSLLLAFTAIGQSTDSSLFMLSNNVNLDVELIAPITQEKLEQQAIIHKEMFEIALENPLIKLVCLWQFNDAQSWLGANAEACIMDSLYNPKATYDSIQSVLIAAGGLITSLEKPVQTDEAFQSYGSKINILHAKPAVLTIYNLKGQIVNRLGVSKGDAIPTGHLKHGMYIATLQTENSV